MEKGLSIKKYWFMEAVGSFYGFDGLIPRTLTNRDKSPDSQLRLIDK
jgi:hypothetical protein